MMFFRCLHSSAYPVRIFLLTCLLAVAISGPFAFAQQGDWREAEKKYNELMAARNYPAALAEAEKLSAGLKAEFGRDHYNASVGDVNVALAKLNLGQFADAERLLLPAVSGYEKRHGSNHLRVAAVLADLGTAYQGQSKWADAERTFKRALSIEESAPQVNDAQVFWLLARLGMAANNQNNFSEAERQYARAAALPERARGRDPAAVTANSNSLANGFEKAGLGFSNSGKPADAERLFRTVLAARERTLGAENLATVIAVVNLASALTKQSKFDQAEPLLERAVAARDKNPDKDVLWTFQILTQLSTAYREQNKYAAAEAISLRALAIPEADLAAGGSLTQVRGEVVFNLAMVGGAHMERGNYADAARVYERLIPVLETMDTPLFRKFLIAGLIDLGSVQRSLARYRETEALARRALALEEKNPSGAKDDGLFRILLLLAEAARGQGKYAEALELYRRASSLAEQRFGQNSAEFSLAQTNLAVGELEQGRIAEAERYLQRAASIFESLPEDKLTLHNKSDSFLIYRNLGAIALQKGNLTIAIGYYERALAIRQKYLGEDHPDVAEPMNALGSLYGMNGDAAKADALVRRSLAIKEKALGPNHPEIAKSLIVRSAAGTDEKEQRQLLERALKIMEMGYGPDHPETAKVLSILGLHTIVEKKPAEAIPIFQRVLKIREKALGPDDIEVAAVLFHLSNVEFDLGRPQQALDYARRSTKILLARAAVDPSILAEAEQGERTIERRRYLNAHLNALGGIVREAKEPLGPIVGEAFTVAQWATQSSAASALQQMSARVSVGDSALAKLVRQQQDLTSVRRAQDKLLTEARAGAGNTTVVAELNRKLQGIDTQLASVTVQIEKEFPSYSSLTSAAPLEIPQLQGLLATDEAMVFFLSRKYTTEIFVVTRERRYWLNAGLDEATLTKKITEFRRGLDVNELQRSIETSGKTDLFDLDHAHELYSLLFGKTEDLIKSKPNLFIVATGSLTAVPFHLLVTDKPVAAGAGAARYRDAAWLLKRYAVTMLPSVGSLKALRVYARSDRAPKPMIGFGDPVFSPEPLPVAITQPSPAAPPKSSAPSKAANSNSPPKKVKMASAKTRAYTDYWQGVGVDRENMTQALPALPDTADELKAVAAKLGVPSSDILLGRAANETAVKRAPLDNYRIVYFATHGLVAGDIKGVGEPSLALSLPNKPSDLDDGLLTASEVAQLKLNADWVVLSACNTIAGDRPGAEALSGLARSFFYAGARALLVTHWAVNSHAATVLTTSTFDILKSDPAAGRSEALRRAMLAYLNDPSDPLNANPAMWGAFTIIGEGSTL